MFYVPNNETRFGIVNQGFGENLASFYAEMGMLGHNGIDFYGKPGNCIYAIHDGSVSYSNDPIGTTTYNTETWGAVYIDSEVNLIKFRIFYGHISDSLVTVGQPIKAGQLIALLGNTGKYTTGPHMHLEILQLDKSGNYLNMNNGYQGGLDPKPLIEDLLVYKSDDLKKLYDYAKSQGEPLSYYYGWGGSDRFEIAKTKLGIVGATRSQYMNYCMRHLFKS